MHEYPNEYEWEPYDGELNGYVLTKQWQDTARMMKCLLCNEAMITLSGNLGAKARTDFAKEHRHSWKQKKMAYRSGWGWGWQ